jgi:hypothetical protein
MRMKFMITDGIRCSLEKLQKSIYLTIENKHKFEKCNPVKLECFINFMLRKALK